MKDTSTAVRQLPRLSEIPTHFPECCASISTHSLRRVKQLLPEDGSLVLSIGSGAGLLEALLQQQYPQLRIEGVEVAYSVNRYLSVRHINVVGGTWDMCPKASEASAWIFVYPREPSLIANYLKHYSQTVQVIIWLGPRMDWEEFKNAFKKSGFHEQEELGDSGLVPYETMFAIIKG